MISGGGVAIGSVGAVQTATVAAAPPAVASQGDVGGKESFAEVMRESTQTDAVQAEAKGSADIAKAPGVDLVAKTPGAKSSVRFPCGEIAKQAASKGNVAADEDVSGEAAAAPAGAKNAPIVKAPTSDVAAQASEEIEAGAQVEKPVVGASGGNALKLPVVGKSAGDEHGKTKTTAATKSAAHSDSKAAQVAATGTGDGTIPAVVSNNAAAGDAKLSGPMLVSSAPQAAVAGVTGDKAAKDKTSTVDGVANAAAPANATSDASASGASVDGASSAVASAGGLSAAAAVSVAVQGSVVQVGGLASAPIHAVNVVASSVAGGQNRDATMSASVAAGHSQGSGAGEVTLSAYDAGKPNQLEVGLQGGSFGWLKVRAEMGTNGEVNAYLRGASTNTTDLLQVQVPKIEAYLGAQDVPVRSVQVEAAHGHAGGAASGFAGDGGLASGGGAAQQQSGRQGSGASEGTQDLGGSTSVDVEREGVAAMQVVASQNSIALTGTGNWLSVRA